MSKKLNGTVIVTYRCNARCNMCSRYKAPSRPEEEISVETIRKLPEMYFTNITGGEPFIREDLKDIVRELYKKSDRIVISTNGFFTDRIVDLCREFPGDVVLTARDKARGRAAVQQLQAEGLSPRFHQLDIDDLQSIRALRDFLRKEYGGLNVLVNNAAIIFQCK